MIARDLFVVMCFVGCVCTQTAPSDAGVLGFDFIHDGFSEDAFVYGSFYGEDLNGDGSLSFISDEPAPFIELTRFDITFTGNSLVPEFSISLDQPDSQAALFYDFEGGPVLGDDPDVLFGLGELMVIVALTDDQAQAYATGQDVVEEFPLGLVQYLDGDLLFQDISPETAVVTPSPIVPEPSGLLIWGFLSVACPLSIRRNGRKRRI